MAELPEGLVIEAAKYAGVPYVWGGIELAAGVDCSGYVLAVCAKRGVTFPGGRLNAEGLRMASVPIDWADVQPGDLLFVEYKDDIPSGVVVGSDGHYATHVAFSLGVGSGRVWSAHAPVVTEVVISTNPWWQDNLIEARRAPGVPLTPLPTTAERVFTIEEVRPVVEKYADLYEVPWRLVMALAYQESGLRNWRVHADQTGHGLFGLDDNGELPGFEKWCGSTFGRGPDAGMIAPVLQIEYVCDWLSRMIPRYGNGLNAASVWHRGPGLWEDARGKSYATVIDSLMGRF